MKVTDFTPQDAQALVAHAQTAPLQNMRHAEAVSKLLQKFAQWHPVTQLYPVVEELQISQLGLDE